MLKKNKKNVSDIRSLTTYLSLLDLLCVLPACFLRLASQLLLSPPEKVSAIRFLTTECLHADGLSRAYYQRPAASSRTSSWAYLLSVPSCCPRLAMLLLLFPYAFAPAHWNVVQRDCCRILVVTIPAVRSSCLFLSFLSPAFPSLTP